MQPVGAPWLVQANLGLALTHSPVRKQHADGHRRTQTSNIGSCQNPQTSPHTSLQAMNLSAVAAVPDIVTGMLWAGVLGPEHCLVHVHLSDPVREYDWQLTTHEIVLCPGVLCLRSACTVYREQPASPAVACHSYFVCTCLQCLHVIELELAAFKCPTCYTWQQKHPWMLEGLVSGPSQATALLL